MGRTRGEPNEIGLTAIGVKLDGSRRTATATALRPLYPDSACTFPGVVVGSCSVALPHVLGGLALALRLQ